MTRTTTPLNLESLSALAGPLLFRVLSLPLPVEELVVVANSFHTKPLRRRPTTTGLAATDRY